MSVYTPLTVDELSTCVHAFGLHITQLTPILNGVENTNYFVDALTAEGHSIELVLTIFEHLNDEQVYTLATALTHAKQHGVATAKLLKNAENQSTFYIKNKPAQLSYKVGGIHPTQPTPTQLFQVGVHLAKLHAAFQSTSLHKLLSPLTHKPHYASPIEWLDHYAHTLSFSDADHLLLSEVRTHFYNALVNHPKLPRGLVHGDLFRDNVLCMDDTVTALLDFSELHENFLLFDIAITLNDFCSNFPQASLNTEKAGQLLRGYQSIRFLEIDEIHALPPFLAMAAARFWVSRTLASQQTAHAQSSVLQENILVQKKSAHEMHAILINRLQVIPKPSPL